MAYFMQHVIIALINNLLTLFILVCLLFPMVIFIYQTAS